MRTIDLNADVGEECGDDRALLAIVTTASVAAGGHAGGGSVLSSTVARARDEDVAVGAHPSYRDRSGFGRVSRLREHDVTSLTSMLREQVLTVATACAEQRTTLRHVKAHGALYHDVASDPEASVAFVQVVHEVAGELGHPVAILGPPSRTLSEAAQTRGIRYLVEAFADRRYLPDGTLVPRSEVGAVLHDTPLVVDQAVAIAVERRVLTTDGGWLSVEAESLCVHGDTPDAVELARAVRSALESQGVRIENPVHP